MINVNKMIEPFPRTVLRLDSHPKKWPFLNVGVRMLNWDDKTVKFYLLGNPFIWWLGTLSIICISGASIFKINSLIKFKSKNTNIFNTVSFIIYTIIIKFKLILFIIIIIHIYI